jgi:hypothetical protein
MNSILNTEHIMVRTENANELLDKNAVAVIYDKKFESEFPFMSRKD